MSIAIVVPGTVKEEQDVADMAIGELDLDREAKLMRLVFPGDCG